MTDHPTMEHGTPENKGLSSGCLLLAGLVLIGGSVVFYGFWQIWATVSDFEDGYLDAGYALVEGADVVISEPVQVDTYIYGKHSILIEKGSLADLALISNDAVIRGIVEGDVAFLGNDIEIAEDGIINGNLNVTMAKNVVIRGRVDGEISGTWTRLFENSNSNASAAQSTNTDAGEPRPVQ
ncbi:MAG: polymer-forming cytoskeletal protein [Phycisphaerales bacterium]|nr:polymer-forming cytoskeletal protein [Phycisphaerales bacterium]